MTTRFGCTFPRTNSRYWLDTHSAYPVGPIHNGQCKDTVGPTRPNDTGPYNYSMFMESSTVITIQYPYSFSCWCLAFWLVLLSSYMMQGLLLNSGCLVMLLPLMFFFCKKSPNDNEIILFGLTVDFFICIFIQFCHLDSYDLC